MLLLSLALMAFQQSQPAPAEDSVGTLIVAHGADSTWNSLVDSVARSAHLPGPVGVSFLMGSEASARRFQDVARDLARRGARRIVVVPLFVSSHSGHYEQLRYLVGQSDTLDHEMLHHLHLSGITRAEELTFHLLPAIDDAPEIARVLVERANQLATVPGKQAVLLLAHGPESAEDYAAWMTNLRVIADTIRTSGGYPYVSVEMLRDDASELVRQEANRRIRELVTLAHGATSQPVIVIPVLISRGSITRRKVPQVLADLPVSYSGEPLAPASGVARWIERSVREATQRPVERMLGSE